MAPNIWTFNISGLKKLQIQGIVEGTCVRCDKDHLDCEIYRKGKILQLPYTRLITTERKLSLVHSNICDPIKSNFLGLPNISSLLSMII